ncbi:CAP domain-containing protein [Xylaria bambusicola]|uniref:CAP domain-containing protein n=1 Tax=Xylaria bambusicola TaxID=326684 RepID=UPI002007CB9A|nr:CAP domain-containing protein [Xylaria bambusicola]KAI0521045.1 CAP domain-containing protein [Xylaria bambusicola]
MKSSIFLATAGAALALANPLDKRVLETEVVVEYYTVTVTGNAPEPTNHHKYRPHPHPTKEETPVEEPETTVVETTKAEPTTTSVPVVYVTVTPEETKEPEPTTTAKPSTVVDTPAQASDSGSTEGDSFESVAVYHHNIHRSNHSSPEVTWNAEIAGYAANTAATCKFAHDMSQGGGGYGQNIALWGVSSGAEELGAAGAVKMATTNMWYDGEFNSFLPSYYGQPTPDMTNFEAWGHLSQVVWAGTTSVGCHAQFCPRGTAYSNLDSWFTVCNYSPPGNIGGAYGKNINKPKGDASVVV